MMQPGSMVPPPMAPMSADPSQQQQPPPPQYQQPPQQWMMQAQQQQQPPMQPQPPAAWAHQPPPAMSHAMPVPYQTQQPQQYAGAYTATAPAASSSPSEVKSLWIGDLQYWMDESYVNGCFAHTGEVAAVKVIRNKFTTQSEGYGFIEFRSHAAAESVLQTYNGTLMPNTDQNFRLNWATLGAGERRDNTPDYTIFVGDLAADVTDYLLQETFKAVYSSVKGAKVVTDKNTGRSKGYGFVKFGDESEQVRALTEMNGVLCSTRPMRIGPAANKQTVGTQQKATYQNPQASQGESDPNNTTIFVGGLDPNVTEEHLRQVFSPYGELVHIKIVAGKRCGFVQFATRASAEQALSNLQGTQLGEQNIRLSWGRSPSNKQSSEQPKWGGGGSYYGYAQGYEAYGYAPPPQDPSMYYGSYPGYTNYQQPHQ
ncbi:polyadenylate-binding protein RBP45-like isoform X2 [Ipomoea triloba]|uniref:polyadenylate-binding protein RBP45-like isoform X2 n=1 Tax=Ipomoea triloba TaxID=35885 RepID=UPI00125E49F7|nr:polyadenylate-binding protein RBP45-like isoform X2 [Ipomoea triloba]